MSLVSSHLKSEGSHQPSPQKDCMEGGRGEGHIEKVRAAHLDVPRWSLVGASELPAYSVCAHHGAHWGHWCFNSTSVAISPSHLLPSSCSLRQAETPGCQGLRSVVLPSRFRSSLPLPFLISACLSVSSLLTIPQLYFLISHLEDLPLPVSSSS